MTNESPRPPRGHLWTHASEFQQTKGYRGIYFEDVVNASSEIFHSGSDDDLSETQRSRKKRRIEKLADDFLNGCPLFISSVRLCPSSIRSTIAWNLKSSSEPKFAFQSYYRSEQCDSAWEDVEEDADLFQRLRRGELPENNQAESRGSGSISEAITQHEAKQDFARSKRHPSRRVTTGSRIGRKKSVTQARQETKSARSSPKGRVTSVQVAPPSVQLDSQWPKRSSTDQKSTLSPLETGIVTPLIAHIEPTDLETESHDQYDTPENNLSSKSDFKLPHSKQKENAANMESSESTRIVETCGTSDPNSKSHDEQVPSYHTAPETDCVPEIDQTEAVRPEGDGSDTANNRIAIRKSILESALNHAGKHKSIDKRADVTSTVRSRHSPGPTISGHPAGQTESQTAVDPDLPVDMQRRMDAFRPVYTTVAMTQSETTPLQYRANKAHLPEDATITVTTENVMPKRRRRRVDFSTPEASRKLSKRLESKSAPTVAPQLELSFGPASTFAPELDIPLVVDHLNRRLPANDDSDTLKSALRKELRNSSPMLMQMESSPATVSADRAHTVGDSATAQTGTSRMPGASASKPGEAPQEWPGTQAALLQAQLQLFGSPEQTRVVFTSGSTKKNTSSPSSKGGKPSRASIGQRSSQERMPSTQQLIDGFGGWSTVKKPRWNRPQSANATPTHTDKQFAYKESNKAPNIRSDPVLPPSENEDSMRHSFHHSMFSMDSPLCRDSMHQPRSAPQPVLLDNTALSIASDAVNLVHADDVTTEVGTSDMPLPSYGAAQDWRKGLDISQAVSELTRDVLCVPDGEGSVFSDSFRAAME